MSEENTPHYPEQGKFVARDAVFSLLPEGVRPQDARVLFIHAHPDDESTSTGATMGCLAQEGVSVDLLTMTRGEMGEVIPPELKHLEAEHPETTDFGAGLGAYREGELAEALTALGVDQHFYLGQGVAAIGGSERIFRDSGMVWGEDGRAAPNPAASADSLTALSLEDEAAGVVAVLQARRPDVVVTYDHGGGYGHPDHRRAYEVTQRALAEVAGTDAEPKLVWGLEGDIDPADTRVQAVIDGSLERKRNAMAAHKTQIIICSDHVFQYSNLVPQHISARETYRLLQASVPAPSTPLHSLAGEPQEYEVGAGNALISGVCLGLLTGFIGTMYHAYIWYISDTAFVPWGAILAIFLVFTASLWNALRSRPSWAGSLVGVVAFLLVSAFAFAKHQSVLVLVNPEVPVGLAGTIWMLGTLAATIVANLVVSRHRRRAARRAQRR